MADIALGFCGSLGFNQGAAQDRSSQHPIAKPMYPDAPPMIAWNRNAPTGAIACAFRRFDDGSYRLESVVYFTAGDSDGGECD
ncbi:hypothetical protein [Burkholderia glumae]|uniref:hypothetical protein n=1 Tax=Burkholderia glumae TaxID=337 RepID=UPI002151E97A|nr:hypothetical protein [Burkholderia glumae]